MFKKNQISNFDYSFCTRLYLIFIFSFPCLICINSDTMVTLYILNYFPFAWMIFYVGLSTCPIQQIFPVRKIILWKSFHLLHSKKIAHLVEKNLSLGPEKIKLKSFKYKPPQYDHMWVNFLDIKYL